ncbi:SMI1/KNR4 family protein [Pedobacter gandavensis]|uniref:SMI1/KNR4 family protein n=1 Tax=Pedobacter gandavensis TaxID=2679963 RepID=UPI00292E60C1|nr:SMI1/KNR4 family protein [Pedobacter gandavensis]
MLKLKELREKWVIENTLYGSAADPEYLRSFQKENNVIIPEDLMTYFKSLNGTGGECTNELYEFYSIDRIVKVKDEFKNKKGIPDYKGLLAINEISKLYVFANFTFDLFVYAIKLYPDFSDENEVYILCGEKYQKIANSFSEFVELYLNDAKELYFPTRE